VRDFRIGLLSFQPEAAAKESPGFPQDQGRARDSRFVEQVFFRIELVEENR
jgi:hypothetical protein